MKQILVWSDLNLLFLILLQFPATILWGFYSRQTIPIWTPPLSSTFSWTNIVTLGSLYSFLSVMPGAQNKKYLDNLKLSRKF